MRASGMKTDGATGPSGQTDPIPNMDSLRQFAFNQEKVLRAYSKYNCSPKKENGFQVRVVKRIDKRSEG